MTSFVTTGLGLHAAAQRVRLETQILNTQIWKRVTNDAVSVRELAPRISGANVRNNQANTGLQILQDHFSSVWVKEEENRSQQWHVSCFMKDQLSQAFLTCNTRAIPHAGQQRSPSVRPLLLKQRKYLPHKYLAARLPASMLAAVNTSRQQPGYN